jgi:hypothetical protein
MDTILDQLTASFENSFSIVNYIAYILICAILLFLLAVAYKKFGQSISNRAQLAKVLMIVGLTTFIIISIVKTSLALSLGLVGALSIVRFRTAIKEPEELGYFFMAIAIGLGMAIPDSMINDFYFYISGYKGNDAIELPLSLEINKGNYYNDGWKGIALPASGVSLDEATVFYKQSINQYLNQ